MEANAKTNPPLILPGQKCMQSDIPGTHAEGQLPSKRRKTGTSEVESAGRKVEGPRGGFVRAQWPLVPNRLRIFTVNVWGLRTPGKIGCLDTRLAAYQVHIGVFSETRLLESGTKNILIPGSAGFCADSKYSHNGRVLIIAADILPHRPAPENLQRRGGEI